MTHPHVDNMKLDFAIQAMSNVSYAVSTKLERNGNKTRKKRRGRWLG